MRQFAALVILAVFAGAGSLTAAESPVGKWKTIDDKSGKVRSEVEIYEQGASSSARSWG
jgi:hypothetical protein